MTTTRLNNKYLRFAVILSVVAVACTFSVLSAYKAEAETYLTASITTSDCGLTNSCTWWYGEYPPTAPGNISFNLTAGANLQFPQDYFNNGQIWLVNPGFDFAMDCNNDGVYGDGSVQVITWNNGFTDGHQATGSCYIPSGGRYTVGVKITRGNFVATSTVTFNIQQRSYSFYAWPFNLSWNTTGPATVPIAIGESVSPQSGGNCNYACYNTTPFTYRVDCSNSGVFSSQQSSNPSGLVQMCTSSQSGGSCSWASGLTMTSCNLPFGNNTVNIAITDSLGVTNTSSVNILLWNPAGARRADPSYLDVNKNLVWDPFPSMLYETGHEPTSTAVLTGSPPYIDNGTYRSYYKNPTAIITNASTTVPFSFEVSGLTSMGSGSYETSIDCGNGQTIGGPSENGRNYPSNGVLQLNNITGCNYTTAGVYTAIAHFDEYPVNMSAHSIAEATVVVTDDSSVASPFKLVWGVSQADSCSVNGPSSTDGTVTFPQSGLPPSDVIHDIKEPLGNYVYKITCVNSQGLSTEEDVTVHVIYVLH